MVVSPVPLTPCLPAPASLQLFERVSLLPSSQPKVPPLLLGKGKENLDERDFHGVFLDKRKREIADDGFARLFIYDREPPRAAIIRRMEIEMVLSRQGRKEMLSKFVV